MDNMTLIKTYNYRHEAELSQNILKSNNIPAVISADDCGGMRPHLSATGGGVQLLVPSTAVEEALALLDSGESL